MLSEKDRKILLGRLSLELGFIYITESTFDDVPFTVEDYSNAILEAEGFTPEVGGDYLRDVRRVVRDVFEMGYEN